jgi:hypothetical protein
LTRSVALDTSHAGDSVVAGPVPPRTSSESAEAPVVGSADSESGELKSKDSLSDRSSPQDADKGQKPGKLDRQAESKTYHFYGEVHSPVFDGARYAELRVTWASALRHIERGDCDTVIDETDPVFASACQAWAEQRIIVLRHQKGELHRAERLLLQLSHWASGRNAALKLMGVPNDVVLPLGDLAADEAWPADSDGALLLVQRRRDPKTTLFFSSNNGVGVRALHERLRARNSRLLISVAAEWDDGEGRLDPFDKSVKTLEVTSSANRQPGIQAADEDSPFDAVPRLVASLFEGLGVEEFHAVVEDLLSGIAAPAPVAPAPASQATPREPARDSAALASAPVPPSRHLRWLAGDVDRVLAELGVHYAVAHAAIGPVPAKTLGAGYCLADAASPYAEPGWVIARHPALLARRASSLMDRYLASDSSSPRFRDAFLVTLARLDATGVRPVSSDWLVGAWHRAVAQQAPPDQIGERLFTLLEYLASDSQDGESRLVLPLIEALADHVVSEELRFQAEAQAEWLHEVCRQEASEGDAGPYAAWQRLGGGPLAGAVGRLKARQTTALWALLLLSRRWPRPVAEALARVLDQVSAPGTPWGLAESALPPLRFVARFAALALHHLLALSASHAPDVWISASTGAIQRFGEAVREAFDREAKRQAPASTRQGGALHGQRLAFLCLCTLAPLIEPEAPDASVLRRLELLPQEGRRPPNDAALIGRLLAMAHFAAEEQPRLGPAGAGILPAGEMVDFLRAVTLEMQGDEQVSAPQAGNALRDIGAGLRSVLTLQQRRELMALVRSSIEAQQMVRDDYERDEQIEKVRLMRRCIRASQAVLRSLSTA